MTKQKKIRVLFVASEASPIIKTGGLADVSAALPAALLEMGVDIRVLLPGYPQVMQALPALKVVFEFDPQQVSAIFPISSSRLLLGTLPNGVPIYVFDCPSLYQRGGGIYQDENGYDWADNAQRYGLFSKVAALLGSAASPISWRPQILHCNDWQAGLVPAYLQYAEAPALTVMTIHNLAFQGNFAPVILPELGLPWDCYKADGVEFYGQLSFMKAGLYYANHITTVSPTYAREIQTEELGFGMQGLLAHRSKLLTGILNGIDLDVWNTTTDSYLHHHYGAEDLSGKAANKRALQQHMGLQLDADIPLFGLVGRFTQQKGLDIVLDAAETLISLPAQLVLLGGGDIEMQRTAIALAQQYPGQLAVHIGFDEHLAHLIEAGADVFLMPSRFEPCGLNQMYSQHYGTIPVVHATGGLIDTVIDFNPATLAQGKASGFVFKRSNGVNLLATAYRAVIAYKDKEVWQALQKNCMSKDFSWKGSAKAYFDIYANLMDK
jgi:starch synthase